MLLERDYMKQRSRSRLSTLTIPIRFTISQYAPAQWIKGLIFTLTALELAFWISRIFR